MPLAVAGCPRPRSTHASKFFPPRRARGWVVISHAISIREAVDAEFLGEESENAYVRPRTERDVVPRASVYAVIVKACSVIDCSRLPPGLRRPHQASEH